MKIMITLDRQIILDPARNLGIVVPQSRTRHEPSPCLFLHGLIVMRGPPELNDTSVMPTTTQTSFEEAYQKRPELEASIPSVNLARDFDNFWIEIHNAETVAA